MDTEITQFRQQLIDGILDWLSKICASKTSDEQAHMNMVRSLIKTYFVTIPDQIGLDWRATPPIVDNILKAFASYISCTSDCLYNQSFLYGRADEFWWVIISINKHLDVVCEHFAELQRSVGCGLKSFTIVYNDFYVITYKGGDWCYSIRYSNLSRVVSFNEHEVIINVEKNVGKDTEILFAGNVSDGNSRIDDIKKLLSI